VTTRARALWILAGLAALCGLASARADDINFRPYLMGTRAAGMGGAYTALADDGSGAWYNPGGVAFSLRSQLSATASMYGLARASFDDALDVGTTRHDLQATTLNTFPTTTTGVYRLGEPRPEGGDVLAIGVFVPDALTLEARDQVLAQANAVYYSNQVQTVWVGGTFAHRWGRLGLGATVFGMFGTSASQLDLNVIGATPGDFAAVTARIDETTYGGVVAGGVRWDPTDALHLGLSVYSPGLGTGSRRFFARGLVSNPSNGAAANSAVVNQQNLSATPAIPLRAQAGVAWSSGALTVSVDGMYLGSRDVVDDPGAYARHVHRNAVVNGSAGVEYVVDGWLPIRGGFFTDFAASPPTVATSDLSNTAHVDRYGGSFSLGLKTDHTATDLGVNVSYGSGQEVVFGPNIDLSNPRVTTFTQLLVYVFLATTYSF
jgi:hypothetical protein